MEITVGLVGTIAGIVAAVVIFLVALRFVNRAREGNSKVRAARRDPHAAERHIADDRETYRDIPQ